MLDHTHLALIVLLYPHEPHDVMEIYVGVGPDFGIGEIDPQSGGLRLLLTEVKTTRGAQTERAIWQAATRDYPWALRKGDQLRNVGSWARNYEETALARGAIRPEECVLWGKDGPVTA